MSGRILLKLGRNVEHVVAHLFTVLYFSNDRLPQSNESFYSGGLHFSFVDGFFGCRNEHSFFPLAEIKTNCLAPFANLQQRSAHSHAKSPRLRAISTVRLRSSCASMSRIEYANSLYAETGDSPVSNQIQTLVKRD
jgi:hypothetical protein